MIGDAGSTEIRVRSVIVIFMIIINQKTDICCSSAAAAAAAAAADSADSDSDDSVDSDNHPHEHVTIFWTRKHALMHPGSTRAVSQAITQIFKNPGSPTKITNKNSPKKIYMQCTDVYSTP